MKQPKQALLMSNEAAASNPGNFRANVVRYAICFPLWTTVFFSGCIFFLFMALTMHPAAIIGAVPFGLLGLLYFWLIHEHFVHGCVNPGVVVSRGRQLIAVLTDLTTGYGFHPAVKVIYHPLYLMSGVEAEVGTRLATVAVYRGNSDSTHWDNFYPIAANCVTGDQQVINRLMNSLKPQDWRQLQQALEQVPRPFEPGLYLLDPTPLLSERS